MTSSVPEARRNRAGKGLLPPNPEQWECEHNGLDLRRSLGLTTAERLQVSDAFAGLDRATVVPHGQIAVCAIVQRHFRGALGQHWSGFAITLDDGSQLIAFNDSHSEARVRATLMEEYFHLKLRHPGSRIRLLAGGQRERTLNSEIERVAYGSGAASLVPYSGLRELLAAGAGLSDIAGRFDVSADLVAFRLKVTKQYRRLRRGK